MEILDFLRSTDFVGNQIINQNGDCIALVMTQDTSDANKALLSSYISDAINEKIQKEQYIYVNESTLLKAKKGDKLKCKYNNSGNKFWIKILDQNPTIDKIIFNKSSGLCKFSFLEDDNKDNFFYENDFEILTPHNGS